MGQKIWKLLLLVGFVLILLIAAIFILSNFGMVAGVFFIMIILGGCYFVGRRLIALEKISTPQRRRKYESKKKKKKRRGMPLGAGLGAGAFLKSGAVVIDAETRKLPTFNDVAGLEEAKKSLQEIVKILNKPRRFWQIGARTPKGALLVGAPGTGKTLLARATAGEAGVPFLSISGSEFVELFVGVGASRVRDLFDTARKLAEEKGGAIIFIDEIDAIGKTRGAGIRSGGDDEREQTLNQILHEMDGFEKDTNIIVMAATNRPELLDAALRRKGRFDRLIVVDFPDRDGCREILKIHTRNKKLAEDVNFDEVVKETSGFSGADLENLANEAAILAAGKNKKRIEMEDFEEAVGIVTIGPQRKSKKLSLEEKKISAFHESGHALVAWLLPKADPPKKISIIPAGIGAVGYTLLPPEKERYLYTKSYLFSQIKVLLAGRIAEEIVFGEEEITTGAEDDLKRATELIWKMVCDLGMSKLGPLVFGKKEGSAFLAGETFRQKTYSEQTAKEIDGEINRILEENYQETKRLIEENRSKLDALAKALLEKDELGKEEIIKILKEN